MTVEVLRGTARIHFRDLLSYRLATLGQQKGLILLFPALGAWTAWDYANRNLVRAHLHGDSEIDIIVSGLAEALLVVASLALVLVAADAWGLLRMGQERRVLAYEIDEMRIVTRDAMGAEFSLPWSNVRKAAFTKRLLLLKIAPRGRRWLLLRAFGPSELAELRKMAANLSAYASGR